MDTTDHLMDSHHSTTSDMVHRITHLMARHTIRHTVHPITGKVLLPKSVPDKLPPDPLRPRTKTRSPRQRAKNKEHLNNSTSAT